MECRHTEKSGLTGFSVIPESRLILFDHLRDSIRVALGVVHTALACGSSHESMLHLVVGLEDTTCMFGGAHLPDDATCMLARGCNVVRYRTGLGEGKCFRR